MLVAEVSALSCLLFVVVLRWCAAAPALLCLLCLLLRLLLCLLCLLLRLLLCLLHLLLNRWAGGVTMAGAAQVQFALVWTQKGRDTDAAWRRNHASTFAAGLLLLLLVQQVPPHQSAPPLSPT